MSALEPMPDCVLCRHADRESIDDALACGTTSAADVATDHGVPLRVADRHARDHAPRREADTAPVTPMMGAWLSWRSAKALHRLAVDAATPRQAAYFLDKQGRQVEAMTKALSVDAERGRMIAETAEATALTEQEIHQVLDDPDSSESAELVEAAAAELLRRKTEL